MTPQHLRCTKDSHLFTLSSKSDSTNTSPGISRRQVFLRRISPCDQKAIMDRNPRHGSHLSCDSIWSLDVQENSSTSSRVVHHRHPRLATVIWTVASLGRPRDSSCREHQSMSHLKDWSLEQITRVKMVFSGRIEWWGGRSEVRSSHSSKSKSPREPTSGSDGSEGAPWPDFRSAESVGAELCPAIRL